MARTGIPSQQIQDKSIDSSDLTSSLQLTGSVGISGSLNIVGPGIVKEISGTSTSNEFGIVIENDITASGVYADFLEISSSTIQASGSNIFGDDIGDTHQFTGSTNVSGGLSVDGTLSANDHTLTIGTPTDASYTDGFFDSFTTSTTIADAIDTISQNFTSLAPDRAKLLTDSNLSETNFTTISAKLSSGLSGSWYVGYSSGDSVSIVTEQDGNFDLITNPGAIDSNSSNFFRVGKNADLSDSGEYTGEGGITASISYGAGDFEVVATRSFSEEDGNSDSIGDTLFGDTDDLRLVVSDFGTFNTFWVACKAKIEGQPSGQSAYTYYTTGSVKFKISADGAGETNAYQALNAGSSGTSTNPTPNIDNFSIGTDTSNYLYLSGVQHWGKSTVFDYSYDVENLYWPYYATGKVTRVDSGYNTSTTYNTYFTDIDFTPSSTPHFGDILSIDNPSTDITLSDDKFSAQSNGYANLVAYKPGHSNVTSDNATFPILTYNSISTARVNTFNSSSTNAQSLTNYNYEYFVDEQYRVISDSDTGANGSGNWDSVSELTNGNLQVQNGRLIHPRGGDYSSLTTAAAYFYRKFTPPSQIETGHIQFDNISGFTDISEWGSTSNGSIQVALMVEGQNDIFDLGRDVGNNVGASSIFGIRFLEHSNFSIGWALPQGVAATASNEIILLIKYYMSNGTYTSRNIYIQSNASVGTSNYGIRMKFGETSQG